MRGAPSPPPPFEATVLLKEGNSAAAAQPSSAGSSGCLQWESDEDAAREAVEYGEVDVGPESPSPGPSPAKRPSSSTSASASTSRKSSSRPQPPRHVYHDYSALPDSGQFVRKKTGGVTVPFPEKLMNMLDRESHLRPDVVSWSVHGRSFVVRRPRAFATEVMPDHFRQSKLTSFQRQLNLYGFRRITQGRDAGAYYHELFLRGRPHLSAMMQRQKVKGTGHKQPTDVASEPNFYAMPALAEVAAGAAAAGGSDPIHGGWDMDEMQPPASPPPGDGGSFPPSDESPGSPMSELHSSPGRRAAAKTLRRLSGLLSARPSMPPLPPLPPLPLCLSFGAASDASDLGTMDRGRPPAVGGGGTRECLPPSPPAMCARANAAAAAMTELWNSGSDHGSADSL